MDRPPFPLSPIQEQILAESLQIRGEDPYTMKVTVSLNIPWNLEDIEQRWTEAWEHFPSLRQVLSVEAGVWRQEMDKGATLTLKRRSVVSGEDVQDFHETAHLHRFDLTLGKPLLIVNLFHNEEMCLGFSMITHHVLCDGQGIALLISRLLSREPGADASPLSNGEYAAWLQEQPWDETRTFWKQYMTGFDECGSLPMVRVREGSGMALRGRGMRTIDLRSETVQGLDRLAKSARATMAIVAYASWGVVLSHYSGQAEVAFATPRLCRRGKPAGLKNMMGITINSIPLRLQVHPEKTLGELLSGVRSDWRTFRPHERLSLTEILTLTGLENANSRLQSTCNFNYSMGTQIKRMTKDPICDFSVAALGEPTHPLAMAMQVLEDRVQISLSYDLELVRTVQAGRMLDCLIEVLSSMSRLDLDACLRELPSMSPQEANQTLSVWNQTNKPYGSAVPVHHLFESGVAAWGDAIALDMEGEYLKYKELDTQATILAVRLNKMGVGPDDLVTLCLPRSLMTVVAIYGTIKAGGAYLPLDPQTPQARLQTILLDASPKAIITVSNIRGSFIDSEIPIICMDRPEAMEEEPIQWTPPILIPENLAYVIYTSGSTGMPKGVMCTHAGLFNRLQWMQQTFLLTPQDRVLQKTAFTFDVSVWEFFWPLLFGGRLVIALPDGHKDPVYLVETIRRARVSITHFVPSMLSIFLKAPEIESLTSLRLVVCSGEALLTEQVAAFYDRCTAQLHNLYGPTEAGIDVTHQPTKAGATEVPIGKPIGNIRVYVLNRDMKPVPIGVPGELFLAGVQLARGYLNRPGLTAERFVIPPPQLRETSRLYRTGDLVRRAEDGELIYLGRFDNQVKVRGFRIELGEIEASLSRFPGINLVVVTMRHDFRKEAYLAAYITLEDSELKPERTELKRFLGDILPAYMVPSVYVFLDEMPLTSSGKSDRRALPNPRDLMEKSNRGTELPQPGMETVVAELFHQFLKVEDCTRGENFFELGGHSLTAAHMAMELQQRLDCDISPNIITRNPVLHDLAEALMLETLQNTNERLNLEPQQRPKHVPASRSQEWMWLLDQLEDGRNTYTIPLGYRLDGPLNLDALSRSLTRLTSRHDILRTTFYTVDGKVYQNIRETASLKPDVRDCNREEIEELWLEGLSKPFDLRDGPLWRVYLGRVSEHHHHLFVMVHHIACDAYGLMVFFDELWQYYREALTGTAAELPLPKIHPADLALWERQRLDHARLQEIHAYWKKRLTGAETGINLPVVRPKQKHRRGEGSSIFLSLPKGLRLSIDELCKKLRVTPYSLLLSAWFLLLQRYSGRSDLVVSATFAGREHRETKNMIAALLNVLPVRYRVPLGIHFGGMCREIHDLMIDDRAHADLSPQQLLQMMTSKGSDTSRVLSPVLFDLKMAEQENVQIGRLYISPENRAMHSSKMDLLLSLRLGAEDMDAYLEYDSSLFERASMEGLLDCFQTLLGRLIRFQAIPVNQLSLISGKQRLQLQRWGAGEERQTGNNLFQLFANTARRYPKATALEEDGRELTYTALLDLVTSLGISLSVKGVGPGENIGIYCHSSIDRIVGLLAVLWTGAAYVPIDTAYPTTRIQYIVADSQITRVLVSETHSPFPIESCRSLSVNHANRLPSGDWPDPCTVHPRSPAYIVFTSGSTGRPKGVVIPHRGACNFVKAFTRISAMNADGRVIQLASPGFDAFFLEWGLALTTGATLVAAPRDRLVPGEPLNQFLREARISHILLPPSIGAVTPAANLPELHTIFFGGEALAPDIAGRWLPGRRCFNAYGPSEVSVATCMFRLPKKVDDVMPIGGPLDNLRVHVLDNQGQPVPVGQPGELCVGGPGVALGYVNRPGLTAARFVPEAGFSGAVMYRTGDRVRWDGHGNLVFIGRMDNQVKIRGFRVEPDEVARVLTEYPKVRNSVVLTKEIPGKGTVLVAYVEADVSLNSTDVRRFLAQHLPAYMLPSFIVRSAQLPLTPSGKIDRAALPEPKISQGAFYEEDPATREESTQETPKPPDKQLGRHIQQAWHKVLHHDDFGIDDPFFEVGGNSILLLQLGNVLTKIVNRRVDATFLFQYPTIRTQTEALGGTHIEKAPMMESLPTTSDIAVIGMYGRFPGAPGIPELWSLILSGESGTTRFTQQELIRAGVSPGDLYHPDYVPVHGVLSDAGCFDATFFGISAKEAEMTDPQQRVFLEAAWSVLEHAGYDPSKTRHRIGVFAGGAFPTYFMHELGADTQTRLASEFFNTVLGNASDFLATRVGYRLGLTGPCVTLQTACSTSLVAVESACRAMEAGTCDMALAGGVSISFPLNTGYVYEAGGILSPEGICRPFDAASAGTVNADGVALVVLKPLDKAIQDGDTIHGVLKGSAITNDGSAKAGFTAPGVQGQSEAVVLSLSRAGLTGDDIGYIETHGTGTRLGDPIEIAGLKKGMNTAAMTRSCALGSIKANVGHLNTAAGVTGLIKACLVVREGKIPPMANFTRPNTGIGLEETPFYIPTATVDWTESQRRASVNSLGLGGTNAHVIIENPPVTPQKSDEGPHLFCLSARNEDTLRVMTRRISRYLAVHDEYTLQDVAHTLRVGRRAMDVRCTVACEDRTASVENFRLLTDAAHFTRAKAHPKIAFLFPGLGGRYAGMGKELYDTEPVYRATVDDCADLLAHRLSGDLRHLLYPPPDFETEAEHMRRNPVWEMAAVFTLQMATARLFMNKGIRPAMVLGLSLGEFAAAVIAEALSMDEALTLVCHRAELSVRHGTGAMLMIAMTPEDATHLLRKSLEICVLAAPKLTGICGLEEDILALEKILKKDETWYRRQDFPLAPHCSMLQKAMQPMRRFADSFGARAPRLPYISSMTGNHLAPGTVLNGLYWAQHLRGLSQVQPALECLLSEEDVVIIDMGPGKGGSIVAQSTPNFPTDGVAVSLYPSKADESEHLKRLESLGKLWEIGCDTAAWFARQKEVRRVPLPTYPFARKLIMPAKKHRDHVVGSENLALFHRHWTAQPAKAKPQSNIRCWYLIAGPSRIAYLVSDLLQMRGETVVILPHQTLQAARDDEQAHEAMVREWFAGGGPLKVVDFRAYNLAPAADHAERIAQGLETLNDLILYLRAVARNIHGVQLEINLVSAHGARVSEKDCFLPEQTFGDGPCLVAPQEITNIKMRRIDMGESLPDKDTAKALIHELMRPARIPLAALRDGKRYIPTYEPTPTKAKPWVTNRKHTVFLITGGLGGLGLTLAEYLGEKLAAGLVLIGRRAWPPREQWERMLTEELDDPRCMVLKRLVKIEEKGARLLILSADVTDREAMHQALQTARAHFGAVHGVIHSAASVGLQDLRNIHPSVSQRVLDAKVNGTVILDELTREDNLDVFILCSSLSGVIGGWGMAVYAATNAFMDAYAIQSTAAGRPIMSIAWEGLDMGMTLRASGDQRRREHLLSEGEVKQWFERCLMQHHPHPIMSARGNPESLTRLYLDITTAPDDPAPQALSLRDKVARAWIAELGGDDPDDSDNFFDMGGSSLAAIGIVRRLRQALDQTFSVYDIMETRTFGAFLARVNDRHREESSERYRVCFQEGEKEVAPLFLFPPAGGNLLCYLSLPRHLDPRIPVFGIRQRGADGTEPLDPDFETMLQHYTSVVQATFAGGPYRLAGSSMGGCIAYEVARRLKEEGAEVSMVALLDTPGPGEVRTEHLKKDGRFDIESYLKAMSPDTLDRIEALRKAPMDNDPISSDLERYHEVFEANIELMAQFCIYPYEGAVLFLRASERDAWNPDHPERAWEAMLNSRIQVATVPGNHLTMLDEPNVREIGMHLQEWL